MNLSRRAALAAAVAVSCTNRQSGWVKYPGNPVLGPGIGTCFDCCVLPGYNMWFSWRDNNSIARSLSSDGVHWSAPQIALAPVANSWQERVNRPCVLKDQTGWWMWYTGQSEAHSAIGLARSSDGVHWQRAVDAPVLTPEAHWEGAAVMCPFVDRDPQTSQFRMWYSAGAQYEPNAIGFATSEDGIHWSRMQSEPVLRPDTNSAWERDRVTAAQIVFHDGFYYAFYIGFADVNRAAIGLARSRTGISGWERYPGNPIISPSLFGWDRSACYKPWAILNGDKWLLWYNGRSRHREQIGLATHQGVELWRT